MENGRIRAFGDLEGWEADEEVDCTGKLLLPGAVDLSLNLLDNGPFDPESEAGVALATEQAARGGVTTVVSTMSIEAGESASQAIETQRGADTGKAAVDFGYHLRIADWGPGRSTQLRSATEAGVPSAWLPCQSLDASMPSPALLLAMLPDLPDDFLLLIGPWDAAVMASNLNRLGKSLGEEPPLWRETLTPAQEAAAVDMLLRHAAGTRGRILLHGISSHLSLEAYRRGRDRSTRVHLATGLPYLLLHDGGDAPPARTWPPLRQRNDQQRLFSALEDAGCQAVVSGHKPRTAGRDDDGNPGSNGIPAQGLSTLSRFYQGLHAEGVAKWRLSLGALSQVAAADPAKLAGLHPRKGSLLPGSDADIVVLSPSEETPRAPEGSTSEFLAPLEDRAYEGRIERVYLRGRLVTQDDKVVEKAAGEFLPRRPSLR